ncbi:MAG: CPBP family intramembrane metalloprotease [Anaerolineales bacterium]|uniref:CPBP family intramembrane glutamic endopeptidase n=1 Tax=Candidatus Villigracilis affinis TaxID=3140682 RepID=UPI001E0A0BA7|nr:CPBP family intramembrane metalloprotease [Anaerolineales bacterium]MBK9601258.1 CPBP family intramembrane metalloprotease [Anaerolineales bacterium]MBL0345367.1 CPBP family intramembrane metalloprotease [Anaerolineales bacterium]
MQKMGMQILWSVLYGILGGLIFLLGLNFLKSIPEKFQDIYKIGLPIPFLIMYFLSQRYLPNQKNVFWAFFLVSMGWMLDFYLTGRFKDLFSLNAKELSGFAYTMVISTLLVSLPVISGWLISNQELSTIYLQWSEGNWGIIVGLIGFLLLGGFGVLQALGQGLETKVIGAAIPMMLVFSLANGFREELVYRAIFLKSFQENIGVIAAVFVTTLVFTLAHIDVSYTPANLIIFTIALVMIGVIGSLIMIKTGSLIGAVLFHAGADVALIIDLLSSHQLILK